MMMMIMVPRQLKCILAVLALGGWVAAISSQSICTDIPSTMVSCMQAAMYEPCGGSINWEPSWGSIETVLYDGDLDKTAAQLCCACGGGVERSEIEKCKTFLEIKSMVDLAPTNGSITEITLDSNITWCEQVVIKNGKKIHLKGQQDKVELNANGTHRHVLVEEGGHFGAENIAFVNGKAVMENVLAGQSPGSSDAGGSIHSDGNLSFKNCAFRNNVAFVGGAIKASASNRDHEISVRINQCLFTKNNAIDEGGAILLSDMTAPVSIVNSLFQENWGLKGGAIAVLGQNGSLDIITSRFTGNNATVKMETLFEQKACHVPHGKGGAVYLYKASNVSFVDITFSRNTAHYGGALHINNLATVVGIENSTFRKNGINIPDGSDEPAGDGGDIFNSGNVTIDSSSFEGIEGDNSVYSTSRTTMLIRNSHFSGNNHHAVIGRYKTCDSNASTICPSPRSGCLNLDPKHGSFGVTCHLPCNFGFFGQAPHCKPCSKGKYGGKIHAYESEACKFSMPGMYVHSNQTQNSKCNPGNFCMGGIQFPCPVGTFGKSAGLEQCDGTCAKEDFVKSSENRTACTCMDTFVRENRTKGFACTCAKGYFFDPKTRRCTRCPDGTTKNVPGLEYELCKVEPLNTTLLIIIGATAALAFTISTVLLFYRYSKNAFAAMKILFSPLALGVFSAVSEVIDFIGDAWACRNIIQNHNAVVQRYGTIYVILLSTASVAFLLGFTERCFNVDWQWKKQRRKYARSVQVEPASVSPKTPRLKTPEEIAEELKDVKMDIWQVYARSIILVFEDIPMLSINVYLMKHYRDVASDPALLFSVLFSSCLIGSKIRAVVLLKKLFAERERIQALVEEE